jgi:type II secretory pathway pseudopilin PulG
MHAPPLVRRAAGERGYLMVALLVTMSIMAIMMSAALPAWHTMARREKEAELVFRGEQYARAIGLWQQKFANQPAPSIDVLVEQRMLRKKYKDPITNDGFQLLGAGGGGAPGQTQQATAPLAQGRGLQLSGGARGGTPAGRGASPTGGFQPTGQTVQGGIVGVTSKSTEKSLRLYNGRDTYNQWVFMPVARGGVGAGARGGAPGPEGRGGRGVDGRGARGADGRGGVDGGGRGLPQGAGPRGGAPVSTPRGRF